MNAVLPFRFRRGLGWAVLFLGAGGFVYDVYRAAAGQSLSIWFFFRPRPLPGPLVWASYALGLGVVALALLRRWPVVYAPALYALMAWLFAGTAAGGLISIPVAVVTFLTAGIAPVAAVAAAVLEFGEWRLRRAARWALAALLGLAGCYTAVRFAWPVYEATPPLMAPLRPAVDAAGVPEWLFRGWFFRAHGTLNRAVFGNDGHEAAARFAGLAAWYRADGRRRLDDLARRTSGAARENVEAFRRDLERAVALAETGLAGDAEALRQAHRILHDLDVHLLGTRRSPEYFGASELMERIRHEQGYLSTIRSRSLDKEDYVFLYIWAVATEALWGTALVLGVGRAPDTSGAGDLHGVRTGVK